MNRDDFKRELLKAEPSISAEERREIELSCLICNNLGVGTQNLIIVMEELGELVQEYCKMHIGFGDRLGLIEEVADCYIGLDFVKYLCLGDDFDYSEHEYCMSCTEAYPPVVLMELSKQIAKFVRGKGDKNALAESVISVTKILINIRECFDISEAIINKAINVKLSRCKDLGSSYQ